MLSTVLMLGMLGAGSDVPERTVTHVQQSRYDLARYANSRNVNDLAAAVADLDGTIDLDNLSGENFTATRRMLVQAWATVLKAIEGAYDPSFDPKDPKNRFPACMPSPLPTSTEGFHSGIVACPDKINRGWEHYSQVLHIDQRAVGSFEATLHMLNGIAPADYGFDNDALDRILQQSGINKAHRAAIDQAMVDSGPHQWRVPMHASDLEVAAPTMDGINASSAALGRYAFSRAFSDLSGAVDALEAPLDVNALKGGAFEKTREALVQAWGAVIEHIEDTYSPTLSPNSYMLVRKLDNRAIGNFVTLLRQFNSACSSCVQSSAELDKLLRQTGLNQATRARIVAATARMLPLASP